MLLLGVYRDEDAGPLLRKLAATTEQLHLPGLAAADVGALMTAVTGTTSPQPVVADVRRRTGGNPFLVRELSRLLVAPGGSTRATASVRPLIDTVEGILERRLARLSQRCVALLALAAVVGPAARLDVLVRVVEEAGDLPALLDEAVAARVLLPPDAPAGPYRLSHDLFRETILAGLPGKRRGELHLAVARALESVRDDGAFVHPAELAAHFGVALAAAPDEAVRYGLLAAEDATSRLAFEEARAHYERVLAALDLAPEAAPAERLGVLLRLGDARDLAGDAGQAHRAYRDAAQLSRASDDAVGLARAALGMHALGWRMDHTEAVARSSRATAAMPGLPLATGPARARGPGPRMDDRLPRPARRHGTEAHLPDSKGLRDLAVLLARPGRPVHAVELHTGHPPTPAPTTSWTTARKPRTGDGSSSSGPTSTRPNTTTTRTVRRRPAPSGTC